MGRPAGGQRGGGGEKGRGEGGGGGGSNGWCWILGCGQFGGRGVWGRSMVYVVCNWYTLS